MDEISSWSGVVVAGIGVVSAWLAGRAARNAAKFSSDASVTNTRVQVEADAYKRARAMDVETIQRQDEEIAELRQELRAEKEKSRELENTVEGLRRRVATLEGKLSNGRH